MSVNSINLLSVKVALNPPIDDISSFEIIQAHFFDITFMPVYHNV